jgi:hypothetical protein
MRTVGRSRAEIHPQVAPTPLPQEPREYSSKVDPMKKRRTVLWVVPPIRLDPISLRAQR